MINEMIYGIYSIQELLERNPQRFLEVYILKFHIDKRLKILIHNLEKSKIIIRFVNHQFFKKKINTSLHQGVFAKIKIEHPLKNDDLSKFIIKNVMPLFLILDGVTDPHNLGACLRSSDAAGVHAVIVPRDRSAQLNSTVKKVARGSAEMVPLIRVTNLSRTLQYLRQNNIWIVGTITDSNRYLHQSKLTGPLALVMGSEGKGIRRLTREHCDELISIKMFGSVSSLNVSVATGICLFEIIRQRISI